MNTMKIESKEFEVVEQISEDLGYEWHEGVILKDQTGSLYWLDEGGCSCNWLGTDTSLADLTEIGSWQEAVSLAKDSFPDDDVFEFANRLRNG